MPKPREVRASAAFSTLALRARYPAVWRQGCIEQGAQAMSMHIQSGKHVVGVDNDKFRSFNEEDGPRSFEHVVNFEERFTVTPEVIVAINHLDVASFSALRVHVSAEEVDSSGFTLRYSTWANTQIFRLGAYWIAFGPPLSSFQQPEKNS